MKQSEEHIMDFLEGSDTSGLNDELLQQAEELRARINSLKEQPLEAVPIEVDERINLMIDKAGRNRIPLLNNNYMWIAASAAAILLAILLLYPEQSLESAYNKLEAKPEKLNYIHRLYKEDLSDKNIASLQKILSEEENPNIKVAVLDIVAIHSMEEQIPDDILDNLNPRDAPTVQMALLNIVEDMDPQLYQNKLDEFIGYNELHEDIKNKVHKLLDKAGPANLK